MSGVNRPDGQGKPRRADIPIVPVVAAYVELRKRGKSHMAVCPFHPDKNPSMSVSEEYNTFNCFGCQKKGGPVQFVMEKDGLGYREALIRACELAGVDVPAGARALAERKIDPRVERILLLNKRAVGFYKKMLGSPAGARARAYAKARGLDSEALRRFGVGYAPAAGDALWRELKDADLGGPPVNLGDLKDAGLADRGGKRVDFFVDRLVFPVRDADGQPVGFSGRSMDPNAQPKYINTVDTPLFKKESLLYNLHEAKAAVAAEGGALWLCEGFMDVIALHRAGFDAAVALMGTNFSDAHARQLRDVEGVSRIVLALDNDAAGKRAVVRCARTLIDAGFMITVFAHPDPQIKDVDELVAKRPDARKEALAGMQTGYFDFFAAQQRDALPQIGRAEALGPAAAIVAAEIKAHAHRASWDALAASAAAVLGVSADSLRRCVDEARVASFRAPEGRRRGAYPEWGENAGWSAARAAEEPPGRVLNEAAPPAEPLIPTRRAALRSLTVQKELAKSENELMYAFCEHPQAAIHFELTIDGELPKGWFGDVHKRVRRCAENGEAAGLPQLAKISAEAAENDPDLTEAYAGRAADVMRMRPILPGPERPYRPSDLLEPAKKYYRALRAIAALNAVGRGEPAAKAAPAAAADEARVKAAIAAAERDLANPDGEPGQK